MVCQEGSEKYWDDSSHTLREFGRYSSGMELARRTAGEGRGNILKLANYDRKLSLLVIRPEDG
jgi:hypothetical protein